MIEGIRLFLTSTMRIELRTDQDFEGASFTIGTTCAVCGQPINSPPAVWRGEQAMDFFLHDHCDPQFGAEVVQRGLGDMVLVMQHEDFHDIPPERN